MKKVKVKTKSYSSSTNFEKLYTSGKEFFKGSKYNYIEDPKIKGYGKILLGSTPVAEFFNQYSFYNYFIQPKIIGAPLYKEFQKDKLGVFKKALKEKVGWNNIKRPDGVLYVCEDKTLYVIEVKYQITGGTTHEKIGAAQYLRWFYERVSKKINEEAKRKGEKSNIINRVIIVYIVNKWLYDNYRDDFEYLEDTGVDYFIDQYPPLNFFGL